MTFSKVCPICGKSFETHKSEQKYCSRRCVAAWRRENLIGKRFGKLTVIKLSYIEGKISKWLCKCDCGNEKEILAKNLKKGRTLSCGCLAKQKRLEKITKHGYAKTRLDNIYYGIRKRCYNITDPAYKWYGGRGIKMCGEWLNDKRIFFDWALGNGYNKKLSIDRIDNNGDYAPENCRWVSAEIQAKNRRSNHILVYNGESHNIKDWSVIIGVSESTIYRRLKKGLTINEVLAS